MMKPMGFFRRKKQRKGKNLRRLVAGFVIGGAVASIVGKRLVDESQRELSKKDEEKEKESND